MECCCLLPTSTSSEFHYPPNYSAATKRVGARLRPPRFLRKARTSPSAAVCAIKTQLRENVIEEDDVLHTFLKDRALDGDFIAQVSDMLWMREGINFVDAKASLPDNARQLLDKPLTTEEEGGFLKLTRMNEWLLGENFAPSNKKLATKETQDDSERRTRLNLLKYEAIKRELLLMTVSIGTACSGYCLVTLSVQSAISYATGVVFSCVYLLLLYQHVDKLSEETVPLVFMQRKLKKIGIRSEDLEDFFQKVVKGSGLALSSSRLVIPAVIYGLWGLSRHFSSDLFEFQLVPAMVGLFAYKAAALVQVYRDNEDLQLIFPDSSEEQR